MNIFQTVRFHSTQICSFGGGRSTLTQSKIIIYTTTSLHVDLSIFKVMFLILKISDHILNGYISNNQVPFYPNMFVWWSKVNINSIKNNHLHNQEFTR